ncbi:amylo-alpha-1,6-glucosidase [Cohnella hashimotonis]|uniref:Amylo-alpha-1,6-glucosidase n=1 Tax=Cohnella hashimotonis TaxID=2826895 RepID=A0ABT6TRC2_9BACL|nr:amylo-alpha-1,6-glucosidase [Cohnella hashimotonis]MDI4649391.1 amylo-alpha-1,6-glucosidase [Cohnella hashimotonis]
MDYRVIKDNDLFLLTDLSGDVVPPPADAGEGQQAGYGLYRSDTRFLSRMELLINGRKPIVLSSEADQNYLSETVLTNPHMEEDGKLILWRESVELRRTRFIYGDVLYDKLTMTNFSPAQLSFDISLRFEADFTDMFVVRGFMGGKLGTAEQLEASAGALRFGYAGADGIRRALRIRWDDPEAVAGVDGTVRLAVSLAPGASRSLELLLIPSIGDAEPEAAAPRAEALARLEADYAEWVSTSATLETDDPQLDALYARGLLDLRVLLNDEGLGRFPVAGLPWYAVLFGRDSLITALQMLPVRPEVALATLRTMARYQGERDDAWRDEQPGKIMHEMRRGELANTNQVPFTPYYGTVDATPLFLVLLAEYVKWTNDLSALRELLPNAEAALGWIDRNAAASGGFVTYHSESAKGIANQGWKDSADSVVHRDGEYARTPIALVEVQGYVYQAKRLLSEQLPRLPEEPGRDWRGMAARLAEEAETLRERFEAAFWMEEEGYYAIALDRDGRQVRSVTSNPGHVLASGLFAPERAAAVAKRLTAPDLFGGYGIRTMAEGQTGYNPMSYHDGSVWPHDNSMCLMGLAAGGFPEQSGIVIDGLLAAATHFENARLPELYCGYAKERGRPVRYPVACSPQAWAAGTPLVMLTAMLGLAIDGPSGTVRLAPALPPGMNRLRARRIKLGAGTLDVDVRRDREGGYEVDVVGNSSGFAVQVDDRRTAGVNA